MSYAPVTYDANGSTSEFSVPWPYLAEADVMVTINGVAFSGVLTWPDPSVVNLSPTPGSGSLVVISRSTYIDEPDVVFQPGTLSSIDMNTEVSQLLFRLQESVYLPSKGDPGGNALSVGLFTQISGLSIPLGTDLIETSGYSVEGIGRAYYVATSNTGSTTYRVQTTNGRWFELFEPFPNVTQFGAKGVGNTFDDTGAFQSGMNYLGTKGGGTLLVPRCSSYYSLSATLQLVPKVSLQGDPSRPQLINTSGNAVFLPGNFHPGFTQDQASFSGVGSTYYALNATTAGSSVVTLTSSSNASHFSVGDQVFVVSTTGSLTGGFGIPDYGWLANITGITSGAITLDHPVDKTLTGAKITDLKSNLGRNSIPLFFWDRAKLADLTIVSNTFWISDTACLDCRFEHLTVTSYVGPYGNCFQYTDWVDCKFTFGVVLSEQSHTSFKSRISRCQAIAAVMSGGTMSQCISYQEASRFITVEDCDFDLSAYAASNPFLNATLVSGCRVRSSRFRLGTTVGGGLTAVNWGGGPAASPSVFTVADNFVEDCDFEAPSGIARWVIIDGGSSATTFDLGLRRNRFRGTASAGDGIRIQNTLGRTFFQDNLVDGALQFNTSTLAQVTGNYLSGGFAGQAGSVDTDYQHNTIRGNSSDLWVKKQLLKKHLISPISIAAGASADILVADLGASGIVNRDTLNYEAMFNCGGASATVTVEPYILDNTTSTKTPCPGNFTIPATSNSYFHLKGTIQYQGANTFYGYAELFDDTTAAATALVAPATVTATDDISLGITITSNGGTRAVFVGAVSSEPRNPYYDA